MELRGDILWVGGRLEEDGDEVSQGLALDVLQPQASLVHRTEHDELGGLLEQVLEQVGPALGVDERDVGHGRATSGLNLPDLQDQMVFWILVRKISQLTCLVRIQHEVSSTPTMAREAASFMYGKGMSSCCRVPFHLPRGSTWHLPVAGSRWSRQPELRPRQPGRTLPW